MESTDFTSTSSVTGFTVIFALVKTFSAVAPHGTCDWQSATFTPFFARSLTVVMCAGFAGGVAISITFLTKGVGLAASPADTTWSMFLVLADAKTSAGAPWLICSASAELASKLKSTLAPLCAASNCLPNVVKASVSDDAAKTLIVPVMAVDEAGLPPDEPPHPATASVTVTAAAAAAVWRAAVDFIYPRSTVSTTTLVDFTTAAASTPGSSSSSSAASLLISDTSR